MMDLRNGTEPILFCDAYGCPASEIMKYRECSQTDTTCEALGERMKQVLTITRNAASEPIQRPRPSMGGLTDGGVGPVERHLREGKSIRGGLLPRAISYAMAVLGTNSFMGPIAAVPTASSSGVMPGVLLALLEEHDSPDSTILPALYNASAIGHLAMRNAIVSGAVGGYQAEVEVASVMAASAAVELVSGTPAQCPESASTVPMNLLGLVCDPVSGLVEYPCQNRNVIGAANALTSAELALSGIRQLTPFDETLAAMYNVGRRLSPDFRETAVGGCAVMPSGRAVCGG